MGTTLGSEGNSGEPKLASERRVYVVCGCSGAAALALIVVDPAAASFHHQPVDALPLVSRDNACTNPAVPPTSMISSPLCHASTMQDTDVL